MTLSFVFIPAPIGVGVGTLCDISPDGVRTGVEDAHSESLSDPTPVGSSIPNIEARVELPDSLSPWNGLLPI